MAKLSSKDMIWMDIVENMAKSFSTCSRKQYAAVVVDNDGRVVGMGYNGSPSGMEHCVDGGCPRVYAGVEHGSNYDNCIAVHAEANALIYSDIALRKGATLIVNGPPCYGCAKLIATAGIKRVVGIYDHSYKNFEQVEDFFNKAKIELVMMGI